jgi:hypothetical protein
MSNLLIETSYTDCQFIKEDVEQGKKNYKIKGIFLQSDIKNKNGRVYSKSLLEREIQKYQDKIKNKRAIGCLDHINSPVIQLDLVSHIIESLELQGNDGYGVARLIDTPKGQIAMSLIDAGVKLGMSTRGVGTMNESGMVNTDYNLVTIDIVNDPSSPKAFVEGIVENTNWFLNEQGDWIQKSVSEMKDIIDKRYNNETAKEAIDAFLKSVDAKLKLKRMI